MNRITRNLAANLLGTAWNSGLSLVFIAIDQAITARDAAAGGAGS